MSKKLVSAGLTVWLIVVISCSGTDRSQPVLTHNANNGVQGSSVLMWKGNSSGNGVYEERTLNQQNVNPSQFGKLAEHPVDGMIIAQPLYISQLDMGGRGVHDVVIVATEHASVYAFDAADATVPPLWERHYAVDGATSVPDDFGGRSTIGREIGITGTPVIDPSTGAMYFVTALMINGQASQWLRAIDIRTGNDFGPGSVQIQAAVPGTGAGSQNGTIAFDPLIQNQRAGLVLNKGAVIIAWGSFSDWGVYHGWVMAYGASDLQQRAVLNLSPDFQADDVAFGPADHGGGAAVWQAGAVPTIDASGDIYLVAADGSFNTDKGGKNYGDSVLRIRFDGSSFQIVDWFTPFDNACINAADLEIGSGGVVQIPSTRLGLTVSKEGRVFLLNLDSLGKLQAGDAQIPQQFLAGANACFPGVGSDHAEGPGWQRLYGNPTYWNGNIYLATANGTLRQYTFQNERINSSPVAQSPSSTGQRGGSTVVSVNGDSAIVWMYEKSANGNAILHAYDAANISRELWNSNMNQRDFMWTGISFGTPVVADGRVFATYDAVLVIYGLLR